MSLSILFVGNYLSAGSRPVTVDLAAALGRAGLGTRLTSPAHGKVPRLLDMLRTAAARRAEYDVAVIDVYSGQAFFYAEAVAALLGTLGKPYVLTLHGGNLPAFARRWPRRVRRLLAGAAAVTAPSRYLAEGMREHRADLTVIPNGLSLESYRFRLRREPSGRLLWLRAFHRIYAPTLALEAVARLVQAFPGLHLTMIGPDKHDGSLAAAREAARRLGLDGRVSFPGAVPKHEVPAHLEAADVFLNTAVVDNTPVSVLEAMAAGLCIVSTDAGGLAHLLRPEHDALVVPAGRADRMGEAVRRVLTERGLAERLSATARESVEECDWHAVVPQWVALLTKVVGSGRP